MGGQAVLGVHAHVKGRVRHVAEAPLGLVKLGGGNAQIQQNAVDALNAQIFEHLVEPAEIAVHQGDPVTVGCQPLGCGLQRLGIPVDADEPSGGEPGSDLAGVARTAQGAVHIDAVGLDIQCLDAFIQQNGNMIKFTHRPIASRDAKSFSGVRDSCSNAA